MARYLARGAALLLPVLQQEVFCENFLDQAEASFSKMTGMVNSAQDKVDHAQSIVNGHIDNAKNLQAQASGYYNDAKATLDGHLDKANQLKAKLDGHVQKVKSLKDQAKETFCGAISISAICDDKDDAAGSSAGTSAAAMPSVCTGGSCCHKSSCYSNFVPGLSCDSDRGATTCVGASVLKGSSGMCQCKAGTCSEQGMCPGATGPAVTRLFEEGEVVPKEDFFVPFLAFLMFVGSTLVLGFVATARRVFSWARPAQASSQREAFIPLGGGAERELVRKRLHEGEGEGEIE